MVAFYVDWVGNGGDGIDGMDVGRAVRAASYALEGANGKVPWVDEMVIRLLLLCVLCVHVVERM